MSAAVEVQAKQLIDAGYFQVSSAYHMLARLPEGYTGRQALFEASMKIYSDLSAGQRMAWAERERAWVDSMSEPSATDQYLRVYAPKEHTVTVSPAVFAAYRKLGGRPAR